jgi:hypothetical protein
MTNFLFSILIQYNLSFKLLKGQPFLEVDHCFTILPVKIIKVRYVET